jgi:hypothetical protein
VAIWPLSPRLTSPDLASPYRFAVVSPWRRGELRKLTPRDLYAKDQGVPRTICRVPALEFHVSRHNGSVIMDEKSISLSAGCLLGLTGAVAGTFSWMLSDNARKYCGSYVEGQLGIGGSGAFELPVAMFGGMVASMAAFGVVMFLTRGTRAIRGRIFFSVAASFLLLGILTLGQFAWLGTPASNLGDSGRCSEENIPEWWPAWLPA